VDLDLPAALIRGDEISVPVVVSNYLNRSQVISLKLEDAPWFERLEDAGKTIELSASEVRATHFRIRAKTIGTHEIQVVARGEGVGDAIKRSVEVLPDGERVERVMSGNLEEPAELSLETPEDAIEGSIRATVKIYPSRFSELVEGIDSIFQMPYGCF